MLVITSSRVALPASWLYVMSRVRTARLDPIGFHCLISQAL